LKRQLPAPELRKVLAIKRFGAVAHITMRIFGSMVFVRDGIALYPEIWAAT
jgi:hypothetical protein